MKITRTEYVDPYEKKHYIDKETKITSELFGSKIEASFTNEDKFKDNGSAKFSLIIEQGGQIENGCNISMCGPLERADLTHFLETLVIELKKIDEPQNETEQL